VKVGQVRRNTKRFFVIGQCFVAAAKLGASNSAIAQRVHVAGV